MQCAEWPPSRAVRPHQHVGVAGRGMLGSPCKSTGPPERVFLLLSPAFLLPLQQAYRSVMLPQTVQAQPMPGTSPHNRMRARLAQHIPLLSEEYSAPGSVTLPHTAQVDPDGIQGSSLLSLIVSSTNWQ